MSKSATAAVGHQQGQNHSRQVKVCMLGAKGAGKTCFLAGLAVLSEPNRKSIITAIHDDPETADYLDSLQATLRSGAWPPPTTATVVLDMTVMVEGAAVDLRVVDYDGEDFTGALRTLDRESVEKLYQFTREADIFLLLFAPQRDLMDDGSAEKAKTLIERQRAHLQAIAQVWREKVGQNETPAGNSRPELGLVITQCDRVPGLKSPKAAKAYFGVHAPNLVERLAEYAASVNCFALSAIGPPAAAGTSANTQAMDRPPPSISPFGYEPLFRWIRGHQARKRWWRKPWVVGLAAATVAVALTGPFIDREMRSSRVLAVLDSPTLTDIEKVQRSGGWVNQAVARRRSDFLREVLATLDEQLKAATTDDDFQRLRVEAEALSDKTCDTGSFRGEFSEFSTRVKVRERQLRLDVLVDGYNSQPRPTAFVDQCRLFVEEYRSGDDVEKVRRMLIGVVDERIQDRRDTIKKMPLGTSSQVAAKANAIFEFTREFERQLSEEEVASMRKAAELARLAAGQGKQGQWEVTLVRSGGLATPYGQYVELSKSRSAEPTHTFKDGGGATKDKTWSSSSASIAWQASDPLCVQLVLDGWWNVPIGYLEDKGPMAIGLFVGKHVLNVVPDSEKYVAEPYVDFRLSAPGGALVTSEDWQAVQDFIVPGNRW